jgi:predicted proteasome-type protease
LLTKIIVGDAATFLEISAHTKGSLERARDDHDTYLIIGGKLRGGTSQPLDMVG